MWAKQKDKCKWGETICVGVIYFYAVMYPITFHVLCFKEISYYILHGMNDSFEKLVDFESSLRLGAVF